MPMITNTLFFILLALAVFHVFASSTNQQKRSADGEEEVRYCQGRTPCGWALYNKTNRFIYDYMRNRCICEGAKKCHRDQDDISISSYVYRCKLEDTKPGDAQNTPATFPES